MSDFGKFLLDYMASKQITLSELSKFMRCNPNTVYSWIYNDRTPVKYTRIAIANRFGYSIQEFEKLYFSDMKLAHYNSNAFADAVLDYVIKAGSDYHKLANVLNVQDTQIRCWVTGTNYPDPKNVKKLSDAIDMDIVECAYLIACAKRRYKANRMSHTLCTLRYALELRSIEMAEILKFSPSLYSQYETSVVVAGHKNSAEIAKWLGVCKKYVLDAFHDTDFDNMDLTEIKRLYANVTKEGKHRE